ncbi:MAG: dihydroorotase [Deltaproteobacteria bacterium]|nr:dihydroorotase [Deltaproteobacteria bacterium]
MWIKGGRILDPATNIDALGDVYVEGEKITGIYPGGRSTEDEDIIDAAGLLVIPGLIDMHAHLRDPGFEYKEDIYTGSLAAAAGGITTVIAMANTEPVNDSPAVTEYIMGKAKDVGLVRILPVGAATKGQRGKELAEMGLMKAEGIVGISDDGAPIEDAFMLRKVLEYAATFGLRVISHPEDKSLSGSGVMNEGALSTRLGLLGIPKAAEEVMVARDVIVSEFTRIPIHITHISTKESMDIVKRAKGKGLPISCDVTPHHLLLTEQKVSSYDTNAKMYPPLREEIDRAFLIKGIKESIIDVIATDHAPHARDEKDLDFDLAPFGVIGLQTLLPAIIKLHLENDIDLMKILSCVTINPARILGIEGGTISPGSRADITIVDPNAVWTFTEDMIKSKSKNSPFIGNTFKGKVVYTIINGRIVYQEG